MNLTNFNREAKVSVEPLTLEGRTIATPDRAYDTNGEYVAFDNLELSDNLTDQSLYEYRGVNLKILYFHESYHIGMLVDARGPRGPISGVKGVLAKVER